MTDEQILEILEQVRPNIKKLAWTFIAKMRQPSIYTVEDLEHEGEKNVVLHIRAGRIDTAKGKPSTYLIGSILTHFIDLMKKSYKIDPVFSPYEKREVSKTLMRRNVINFPFDELDILSHITELFTSREKEYLAAILFPSGFKSRKTVRKTVRELLNMSPSEERLIRKEIKKKLTGGEE